MTVLSRIRRQGAAAIVTIPPPLLEAMQAGVGSQVELAVRDGELVARPVARASRGRYGLAELLKGAEHMVQLQDATAPAPERDAVGREVA